MIYATTQHITDRYGEDALLIIADRDGDDAVDAFIVDQALLDASAEIDTWLAAKYKLPLPQTPDVLVRLCVDIVMYRLAASADMVTEEKRQRFDDAINLLKSIASGKASLGLEEPAPSSNGSVFVNSNPRRFKRGAF